MTRFARLLIAVGIAACLSPAFAANRYGGIDFVDSGTIDIVNTKNTTTNFINISSDSDKGLALSYPLGAAAPKIRVKWWGLEIEANSGYSFGPGTCTPNYYLECVGSGGTPSGAAAGRFQPSAEFSRLT